MNKVDQVDDEELLELVEMEIRELLSSSTITQVMISQFIAGSALAALEDRDDEHRYRDSIAAADGCCG